MNSNISRVSYALRIDTTEEIDKLAEWLGKKKSQIITEAIDMYYEKIMDYKTAAECDNMAREYEAGQLKTYTQDEIMAMINARLESSI